MSGPWERYQRAPAAGPWTRYQGAPATPAPTAGTGIEALMAEISAAQPQFDALPQPDRFPVDAYGPGMFEMPMPEMQGATAGDIGHGLHLGTQAVGSGLAGLAGAPTDIMTLGLNAGTSLANLVPGVNLPTIDNPVGGSNSIRNVATDATRGVLGDGAVIDQADMTPAQRIMYQTQALGAEGLLSGAGLAKGLHKYAPTLGASYTAPGSMGRVLAGDTAAGAGSGAAMGAYNEMVPEENQGPIGMLLSGLAGGVGGATSAGMAERLAGGIAGLPNRYAPATDLPLDPTTNMPYRKRDEANAAALLQGESPSAERLAADRAALDDFIAGTSETGQFGPGPAPTTGLITNNPATLTRERRDRATNPVPYIDADRRVMSGASERVGSLRDPNADPELPGQVATQIADERIGTAQQAATEAQAAEAAAALARQERAAALTTGRSADQSSRDLDRTIVDETYLPARREKNELFDEAMQDPDVVVRTENTRARATAESERIQGTNPALRDNEALRVAESFRVPQDTPPATSDPPTIPGQSAPGGEAPVVRPLADVARDRAALSQREQEARAASNFGRADTLRSVRTGINEDIRAAAESGVPGTERLAAADRNYREKFAPYFRDGNVSPDFFRSIDRDPGRNTAVPEATAAKFLTAGPTSRAAAEDLAKILEIAPNRAEGVAAATDYAIADAVGKGIVRDGEISETALAQWMSKREGMLDALPELRQQFDEMLDAARTGSAEATTLSAQVREAADNLALTQRQIDQGALSLARDATPENIVRGILSNRNPPARMRELISEFEAANNPQAVEGLKAAVTDHLIRRVSTAGKAAVSDLDDSTLSLAKLRSTFEDNRQALAAIYTPEEMQVLNQVQSRLELMSRRSTQASTGSATAEAQSLRQAIPQAIGHITTLMYGALLGGSYERRSRIVLEQFPDATEAARRIVHQATFDPKLARHLLDAPVDEAQMYTWTATLNRLLVAGEAQAESED